MNLKLLKEINKHILDNFGILENKNVVSVRDPKFLLNEKVFFSDEENEEELSADIYGCECLIHQAKLKVLYTVMQGEHFLFVKLENQPSYCIYYPDSNQDMIYFCQDKSEIWGKCSTYIQATFLAALENIKDIYPTFSKAKEYKEEYSNLLRIIEKISNEQ